MASSRPILMPKLGLTMTEGVLIEWKVAAGDTVAAGEVIFVVETDKISNEIEASETGVMEALLVPEGELVQVGTPVATLAVEGIDAPRNEERDPSQAGGGSPQADASPDRAAPPPRLRGGTPFLAGEGSPRLIATPLARRMAAEAQVDLASVAGSGPRGRIMADDIAAVAVSPAVAPALAPPAKASAATITPLGGYQKVAARRLTEAKRDIPHFYIFAEADVTELLGLREGLNADGGELRLSVSHFLLAAMARSLAATPEMNRVWQGEGLLELGQVDIGLAIESPKGLVAPVLRDLGAATLDEVARATNQLIDRARAGRLGPDELSGGASAISNVGMFGATGLLPIINPGQSSIMGVGASQGLFRPDAQGQPALRQILGLSLSCDHRVIDGALAARFLQAVQRRLEAPHALLRAPNQGPQS